jgi:hypothetical protein
MKLKGNFLDEVRKAMKTLSQNNRSPTRDFECGADKIRRTGPSVSRANTILQFIISFLCT